MAGPQQLPYPGPDTNISGRIIGGCIPLVTLSVLLYLLRMYTRIRPIQNLSWDDWTISGATLCSTLQVAFVIAAIPHGYGRHDYYVSPEERKQAGVLLFASQMPWTWAVALAKISIACMLLRIKHSFPWKAFLYAMIAVQILSGISANVVQFGLCRPLLVNWDPLYTGKATCWPSSVPWNAIIVNGAIAVITDIMFTYIPITFVYKISRPLREKIVVSFLMALGILAAIASIIKITKVRKYGTNRDRLYDGIDLALWSVVEAQVGIIAACVPCLKSPSERVMRRLGLLSTCEVSGCTDPKHKHSHGIDLSEAESGRSTQVTVDSISDTDRAGSEQGILGAVERRRSVPANEWDTEAVEKTWVKSFER